MVNSVSADNVETNSGRRFVTDKQIEQFSNKVDKDFVQEKAQDTLEECRRLLIDKVDNIINMKDVIYNLEVLRAILSDDNVMMNVITAINDKAGNDVLTDHMNDNICHITSDDRNNLNLLSKLISAGGYDWNAKENDPGFIKNKPAALPANGGNSNTVCNMNVDDLLTGKRPTNFIIGISDEHDEKDVDVLCNDKITPVSAIKSAVLGISEKTAGHITIMNGVYNCKETLDLYTDSYKCPNHIVLQGLGQDVTYLAFSSDHTSFKLKSELSLRNMNIYNTTIEVYGNDNIKECDLYNCTIIIKAKANTIKIMNCNLYDSNIIIEGEVNRLAIINNMLYNNSNIPSFAGISNVIYDNYSF